MLARCAPTLSPALAPVKKLHHRRVYLGIDIVDVSAMRCVVASMVLLAISAGATEPREDLKPLGTAVFCVLFGVAVRSCA